MLARTVILLIIVSQLGCAPAKNAPVKPLAFTSFPVLEYHLIGRPEGRWQRTPENFRADLEWLQANNYYPLNLRDILDGFGAVPAGKRPVVLTFDDSSAGQFRYLPDGKLDPESAVGMLKAFHDRYPADWPLRGTFFVLMETSSPDRNLFGQPESVAKKLRQLTEWGMELGCHTYSHDRLDRVSPAAAKRSLDRSLAVLAKFSGRPIVSLSLPLGKFPTDRTVIERFKLVAEVAGGMNPVNYDPLQVKRIQAMDSEWQRFFKRAAK
ncbi:MAG: polysaccharide deacetylase family protein [Candidatus Margulisbacteria bacterium]|jgi:peptidoglycan/xylan/chitin deacetylase (PgdA/CDA1 family)|nr:polysaccharide deacetylase family protein [Candidatus Margulisiibacteriota bacterium]